MSFAICNFLIPIETSRELYDNCGSPYIFSFFLEYVAMCCIITNETGIESAGSLLILLPGISKAPVK